MRTDVYIHYARDTIHPDYGKVKHIATVQEAVRKYKSLFPKGGSELKIAEEELNRAVEKALSPK